MNPGVIESDATGQQTGVTTLAVDVLVCDVHERDVTTELTLMEKANETHQICTGDIQEHPRLTFNG